METSYDVRIYKILTYRGSRKTSYTVRWMVAGKPFREPFGTSALADSFRSELVSAARRGEAFSLATGRPISHQSGAGAVSWYDFAIQFTDAQWRRTSGNNRKNVAKALMTTTIALLRAPLPSRFAAIDVRTALREFAFNTRRRKEAPHEVTAILRWVERNTLTMAAWEDPQQVEDVLHALDSRLDGTAAAASSSKRHRRILNVAMEYAVKNRVLRSNPLPKGRGTTPKTSSAVDKRSLHQPDPCRGPARVDMASSSWWPAAARVLRHHLLHRPPARRSRRHAGPGRAVAGRGRRRPVGRAALPHGSAGGRQAVDRHRGGPRKARAEGKGHGRHPRRAVSTGTHEDPS